MTRIASNWQDIRRLFDEALALNLPESDREHHVRQRAATPEIAAEVLALLANSTDVRGQPSGLDVGTTAAAEGATLLNFLPVEDQQAGNDSRSGQRLGAWRLLYAIGAGGMGDVWLAERSDGSYQGQAAVKVLKRGMDSASVLARFNLERQSLARLDHPHIAKLLDAGITPDGLPYFVMEHVQGLPIDAATAEMGVAQRLEVFLQLADAVSHAHRNLLVHRDLKPSNVLVNTLGQVKLLDFGIAKALDATASAADQTRQDERPFTPAFASPEQVRGEPVSTATDVYSLGVLLYVLLTGAKPYARDTRAAHEIAIAVLNDAPSKPSGLSAQSTLQPNWEQVRKRLAGDLDNILLKSLAKAPHERYASVDAFANDIRAHLSGHPVSARPHSVRYMATKFVQRNKLAVALAAAAMFTLVGGTVAVVWQAKQTELARRGEQQRFAEVRRLVNQMVFKYHDQIANLPGANTTREALLKDASTYVDQLYNDAKSDPSLARDVAETYLRLAVLQGERFSPNQDRLADASRNIDRAISLLPRYVSLPNQSLEALSSGVEMWRLRADLHQGQGKLDLAESAFLQATAIAKRASAQAPDKPATIAAEATLIGRLGILQGGSSNIPNQGRIGDAVKSLELAVALFRKAKALEPANPEWAHQLAWGEVNWANALVLAGRGAAAVEAARRAVAMRDEAFAKRPGNAHMQLQTGAVRNALAGALAYAGQHEEAQAVMARALEIVANIAALDANNKGAANQLTYARYTQARVQVRHALATQSCPEPLRAKLLQSLADMALIAALGADRYASRFQGEGEFWTARCTLVASDLPGAAAAQQALVHANKSVELFGGNAQERIEATRAWGRAQALGERARAQSVLGQADEAKATAQEAVAQWRAVPKAEVPAIFAVFLQQAQALAQ